MGKEYYVAHTDSRGYTIYFSKFGLGAFPEFVSQSKIEEARKFEGPKSSVRQWIKDFLGTSMRYDIVEVNT